MSLLTKLRANEPVRLYVYPLLVALLITLVGKGVIDASVGDLVTAAVTALLGLTATEAARAQVTPQARVVEAAVVVAEQVRDAVNNGVSPEVQAILDRARETAETVIGKHRAAG